ncbi:MAG: hypothetical protein ACOCWO_02540 [Candidatus Muiribacteriaceae bacterium]
MKKIMIAAMIAVIFMTVSGIDTQYNYDGVKVSESLKDGKIILALDYMKNELPGEPVLHYGVNGWNGIQDLKMRRGRIQLVFPRDTWRVEFCFRHGQHWDNNAGMDWYVELANFLPESFSDGLGNELEKHDIIKEKHRAINSAIYYIETIEDKTEDDIRYLKSLYEMKELAEDLLPRIMRVKDKKKDITLECDLQKFLSMTEGL